MFSVRDNVREVLSFTDRLSAQYEFAVASALTATVKSVAGVMPAEAEKALDDPTPFTQAAYFIQPARKERLVATVGVKARQAEYLAYQVEGGERAPRRKALRLPADVPLDQHGNLPPGLIRQLVNRARQGKRATKSQARRFGVSQLVDLFYGEPGDGRPAGVYKRVVVSSTEHRLIPVVVFPKQSARYDKRLDFHGKARRVVVAEFEQHLRHAWARAKATAR